LYSTYPIGDFVAYQSDSEANPPVRARFDTDSFRIGVDTLASCTMSGNKECFENLMLISNGPVVDGFAGNKAKIAGKGTFCFKIEDSKGRLHTIKLPNSAYIPGMKLTLLCPQHWAASTGDDEDGTYIKMGKNGCWLVWDHARFSKYVPLEKSTNTPIFNTAPGSFNYRAFEATHLSMDASNIRQPTVSFNNLHHGIHQPADPAEFIANEDINRSNYDNIEDEANEGVTSDDETVLTNNLSHSDLDPYYLPFALFIQQVTTNGGNAATILTIYVKNVVPFNFPQLQFGTMLKLTMMPFQPLMIKPNCFVGIAETWPSFIQSPKTIS
jgi:hypothetical protein